MKVLIAMPCAREIKPETFESCVGLRVPKDTEWMVIKGANLYEARNRASHYAIDNGFTHLMWLDDDMTFNPDTLYNLILDDKEIVSAMAFRRTYPYCPVHMRVLNEKQYAELTEYPDELFTVEGVGLGVALTKVSALKTILETEGELFLPIRGLSEDYSFSIRARKHFDLWVDPKIKTGHIAPMIIDERWYKRLSERKSR